MGQLSLRWLTAVLLVLVLGLTACEQDRADTLEAEPTSAGNGEIVLQETPGADDTGNITDTETLTSTGTTTDTGEAAGPTAEGGVPAEPTPAGEVPSTPGTEGEATTTDPNAQPTTVTVTEPTPEPGTTSPDGGATTEPVEGTYTVQAGDTLFSIAVQFNTTVDELIRLNALDPNAPLTVGQVLKVPGGEVAPADTSGGEPAPAPTAVPGAPRTHTVANGEWLYAIARIYNVDPQAIIAANPGINPDYLQPGQVLVIP